jgi:hypothetical protein
MSNQTKYSLITSGKKHSIDYGLMPSFDAYFSQHFKQLNKNQLCPLHDDRTASLKLYRHTHTFYCFGCQKGGDIIAFHMAMYGLNYIESCRDLGLIVDLTGYSTEAKAERLHQMAEAEKAHQARLAQAERDDLKYAQDLVVLSATIKKLLQPPMFEPPYPFAKGIQSQNLFTIEASVIQRFNLPKHPQDDPKKRPITVCWNFQGVLTVAILETLDGEQVVLQVFDGVPDEKDKYARWFIGRPFLMDAYYFLGDWTKPLIVIITEGVADAISCYEATGYPVMAALSKDVLVKAAKAVKAKYPQAKIVICGDNDAHGGGQRAANDAAKAVGGLVVNLNDD